MRQVRRRFLFVQPRAGPVVVLISPSRDLRAHMARLENSRAHLT